MAWSSGGTTKLTVTHNLGLPENTANGTDLRLYHRVQSGSAARARHGTLIDGGTESKSYDRNCQADGKTKLNLPENTQWHASLPQSATEWEQSTPCGHISTDEASQRWPCLAPPPLTSTNVAPLSWLGGRWVQRGWAAERALRTGREAVGGRVTN